MFSQKLFFHPISLTLNFCIIIFTFVLQYCYYNKKVTFRFHFRTRDQIHPFQHAFCPLLVVSIRQIDQFDILTLKQNQLECIPN